MDFASSEFIGFVLVALFFHRWLAPTRLSPWVFAAINLAFIARFARGPADLVPFFGFVGLGYIAHLISLKSSGGLRRIWPVLPLLAVAVFIYIKQYSICSFLPRPAFDLFTLGMSFILFRMIQVMIDSRDGELRAPISPLRYFNFTCSFLTLVSGPIQRYQDFAEQTETQKQPVAADEIIEGVSRIVTGFLKTMLWAALAKDWYARAATAWETLATVSTKPGVLASVADAITPAGFVFYSLACGAYLLFLFFNFSGYTDIVIGIGRCFGWKLPENFSSPFACSNFLDLWARWHMSLSNWFKIYLYNPLLKAMVSRFSSPKVLPYLGCLAFFATFFVMGVWHGTTTIFLTYGLVLGAGVSINKLYQIIARKKLGKQRHDQLTAHPLHRHLSRGLALAYFAVALTSFWITPQITNQLQHSGVLLMLVSALALLTFCAATISSIYGLVSKPVSALLAKISVSEEGGSSAWSFAWLLLRVALLVGVVIKMGGGAPDFVYKAF